LFDANIELRLYSISGFTHKSV